MQNAKMKVVQLFLALLCLLSNLEVKGNPCELNDYKDLNQGDRSEGYKDATDKCDSDDLADEWHYWYIVTGNAGNALSSNNAPQKDSCGTKDRLYLKDAHPEFSDGEVTKRVCVAQGNTACASELDIQIINCGAFYLYKLVDLRDCSGDPWRYCTNGEESITCEGFSCPDGQLCSLRNNGKQKECVSASVPPSGDPCSSDPCQNGGTCNGDNSGGFTCSCPSGYTGDNCSTSASTPPADPCSPNPCQNGGTCNEDNSGGFTCSCPSGYTGDNCSTSNQALDPCSTDPCQNGGTCNDDNSGGFTCSCPSGYTGDTCSTSASSQVPPGCQGALGVESGQIPDGKMAAKSSENVNLTGPNRGRLNLQQEGSKSGGWVAGIVNTNQWFVVRFENDFTIVTAVATQGRQDEEEWVTKYHLQYRTFQNFAHTDYIEPGQNTTKEFVGNTDQNSVVHHELSQPITRTYVIKFLPQEWHNGIAMRVEIYGCKDACMSSPCQNSGTCTSNYITGGFTCSCPSGYTGNTCATGLPPDPCSPNPCQNGGTCNSDSGSFTCSCPPPYTGDDCSTKGCQDALGMESGAIEKGQLVASSQRDSLAGPEHARLNLKAVQGRSRGAWIAADYDYHAWFQVHLINPYTLITGVATQGKINRDWWVTKYRLLYWGAGVHVQWYKEQGQSGPFKEFAGNTDRTTIVYHELSPPIRAQFIRFMHLARVGKTAMRLELYGCQDACLSNPCLNGGTCISNYTSGTFTCNCPSEYFGETCALVNQCLHVPCLNGGSCSTLNDWPHFECTCPSGYIGFNCGTQLADPCLLNACLNGGSCSAESGWPYFECSCPFGYIGFNCGTQLGDPCVGSPCLNGGNCTADENSLGFTCSCTEGYTTYNCGTQQADPCSPINPCLNGGTCSADSDWPFFTCSCPPGYIWYNCGFQQADPCSPDPCLNGGVCTADSNPLGFKCSCPSGYIGLNCAIQQGDPCLDEPCKNGGKCAVTDNLVGFECNCTSEYIGFDCGTLKEDPCSPNPCENNGSCTIATNTQGFTCNCSTEYTGDTCENKKVHGNWSSWSPWPNCNKPCNGGVKIRKRLCDNPEPAFGGKNCTGPANETEPCNLNSCPPEEINYKVKLTNDVWNDNLANPASQPYIELQEKIKQDVKGFYTKRDFNVVVKVLGFREGSVISSFNVTYPSVDSLQIVSLQEELAGGTLVNTPAKLLNITTTNVPNEAPVILEAESTTSTSIDLKWSEVNDSMPILGYVIIYKEINKIFQADIMKSVEPLPREAVLEDLKKFTNYTIRVYAFTANGNGVPSEAASLRTQEDVPSQPPPNSVIKSTSTSTIDVSWEPISQAFVHGILLGYEVRYAKDDGSSPLTWETVTLDANTLGVVLSDLEYFTRYKVVVCARTSKGCGEEYSDIAYTYGDVPSMPPQTVTAHNLTSAVGINVTWTPVPMGHVNGLLMGYSIKYRRIQTAEREVFYTEEYTVTVKSTELLVELPVQTYSIYEIRVAAFTQKGMGPYSEFVHGETCRCPEILYTNYWSNSPYLKVNDEDNTLEGVLSNIVTDMVHYACGICPAHGDTFIDVATNGKEKPSAKKSVLEVLRDMDDVPQISFPIYGNQYIERYMGEYAYINLVESPGVAFIAAKRPPGKAADNMMSALFDCLPLLMLSLCMAFISGFIIWILDCKSNPDEFPGGFRKGVGEGFWWSFVSMTTVGYGDRSPRSIPARIFAIMWTLTGLVIIGILIGAIASSLTSVTVDHSIILYGSKIGAIHNSTEHQIATRKNARVNEERKYRSFEELRTALEDGEIDGALLDTYVAAEHKEEIFSDKIYVKEILDRPFGYGVVLSGAARNVEQRCRDYIDMQIRDIFDIIQNTTKTLDPADPDEEVEESTGLFDGSSDMFFTAMASLLGILGVAVIAGLVYQYLIFVPGRKRVESLKASASQLAYKEALVAEMREFVDSFHSEMCTKITAIMRKYERAITEINTTEKQRAKQRKEFAGLYKEASVKSCRITNPVYSGLAEEQSYDLNKKRIWSESTKYNLDQHEPWHSLNSAALTSARKSSSTESACPSLLSYDGLPVTRPKEERRERRETNLHKSKVKRF
ncbi:uncharacterized protein LOC144628876 isoform X2 [Oculina patagonica]